MNGFGEVTAENCREVLLSHQRRLKGRTDDLRRALDEVDRLQTKMMQINRLVNKQSLCDAERVSDLRALLSPERNKP